MSRVRQIYQSAALFVSPSPATGYMFSSGNSGVNLIKQVPRVQNSSLSFSVARTDVNQLGEQSAIDRLIIQPPTANLNFSYYPIDGKAEALLGFDTNGIANLISGLIDNTQGEKNYFLAMAPEGYDYNSTVDANLTNVISISNGFISNYSTNLAVGQIPTTSVSVEGLNAQFDTGSTLKNTPAIIPENGQNLTGVYYTLPAGNSYTGQMPSAIRPGDIKCEFPINNALGSFMSGANSINIQSVSLAVPLSRNPIQRLGVPFPFTRVVQFPLTATITVDALATEIRESKLSDVLCNDEFYNFRIKLNNPSCGGTGAPAMIFDVKRAKLDSQDYNLAIGDVGSTVRMSYSCQIGSINSRAAGIYLSGTWQNYA